MSPRPLVIVKVGGSLLTWAELPQRLGAWLRQRPPGDYVLIAGTGPVGDVVRHVDDLFGLGEERSHWLCVDALSLTARLLSQLLDAPLIDTLRSLPQLQCSKISGVATCVFDPRPFLHRVEPMQAGTPLPHCWDVTTDSIAARLAECASADELVLFKSCDPPAGTIEAACDLGYLDGHFAAAAKNLPRIVSVNLRGAADSTVLRRPSDEL